MSLRSKSVNPLLILGGVSVSWVAWNSFGGRSLTQEEKNDQRLRGGGGGTIKTAAKEWFSEHAQKLFQEGDLNKDGTLDFKEVYVLVLKFYIEVNRKAPIPPPSRQRVLTLLRKADKDKNGTLNAKEFEKLLSTLYARASSRVLTHQFISNVCAPFCAVQIVAFVRRSQPAMLDAVWSLLPAKTPDMLVKVLAQENTWIALVTGVFCKQLVNLAMEVVDRMWWGENAEETFYQAVSELKDTTN